MPVPGRVARVADVDVDREEDRVAVVEGDLERLVEAGVEPALADLGHLVGAHLLLGHPVQRLGAGPVAAQPHLQEAVAAQRAGLDQPAHRLAVAVERAELDVAGVGVGVEVDHRDPAEAEVPGDAGGVREGDRVVAAEHQRHGAGRGDGVHRLLEGVQGALDLARRHLDVAHVDDGEVLQRVDAQREVGPRAVLRQVAGLPDRRRAEAGARAGATYRRRRGRRRPRRRPRPAPPRRRRRTAGTPRKVMSGPNCGAVAGHGVVPISRAGPRHTYGFRHESVPNTTDSLAGTLPDAFIMEAQTLMDEEPIHMLGQDDHVYDNAHLQQAGTRPPVDALHPALRLRARPTCRSSCAVRAPTSGTATASATSTAWPACS